jgi:phosphoglycerate dehydrogenase-like enzyme
MPRLTIWTNALLTEEARRALAEATQNHRLIIAEQPPDVLAKAERDPEVSMANVVFGQPDPVDLIASEHLRWVQISSAGYTRYDLPELKSAFARRNVLFTNSSQVFAEPCAQHLMAWLLADGRELYPSFEEQRGSRGWSQNALREKCRLLADQTILIVGLGSIARRLIELLAPYPVRVLAHRRTPQPDSPIRIVGIEELPAALATADHVINILPQSVSTNGFFEAARFAQLRAGARYYSIGRGTTTDQSALIGALQSGHLGAAYLDVTDPEPLPPDHPLWSAPNCYITPHTGGGHATESTRTVEHFLNNLRRFELRTPLIDRVW